MLSIDSPLLASERDRMEWNNKLWQRSLDQFPEFMEPLVAEMGRSERCEGAALYVQGLLMPGERKSTEPLAAWIVDETGWLKQGDKSVGVSHQYCGAEGKQANCQVSVEVVVSDGEIAAPVAGRLYLPESWAGDSARGEAAGGPRGGEV